MGSESPMVLDPIDENSRENSRIQASGQLDDDDSAPDTSNQQQMNNLFQATADQNVRGSNQSMGGMFAAT